jgi:hypothetical protein
VVRERSTETGARDGRRTRRRPGVEREAGRVAVRNAALALATWALAATPALAQVPAAGRAPSATDPPEPGTAGAVAAAYCRGYTSDTTAFRPQRAPSLDVHRATGPIHLDGTLDDPGWSDVEPATRFTEFIPDQDVPATVGNMAFVTYDDHNLYVALVACDDPSSIRATFGDRDDVEGDDIFGIFLDTYGSGAWAYELFANPMGIQLDWRRVSGQGKDITFDVVYHTAAKITDYAYQVEFAVPFASLRFPDRPEQTWGITFLRHRPRASEEEFSWAAIDLGDPCLLCQMGTLTGIRGVHPGGALEILPSAVGTHASQLRDPGDPGSGFEGDGLNGQLSLGAKYAFATGVTAEATINPDFSQVESDAAQIDVNTTFALFFPEKRPFFQEGSDLFQTPIQAIYTRTVNDPRGAAKFTLRSGKSSVAYLAARDEHSPLLLPFEEGSFIGQAGRSFTNILRAQENFSQDSHVGLTVTDRRLDGGPGSSTVAGPDVRLRLGRHSSLEYQLLASHTREPDAAGATAPLGSATFDDGAHTAVFDGESFWGYAQHMRFAEDHRHWQLHAQYDALSPTFRAENGFVPQNDERQVLVSPHATAYPLTGVLNQVDWDLDIIRNWNFDGVRKQEFIRPTIDLQLTGQTYAEVQYYLANERFRGVDLRGIGHWYAMLVSSFSEPVHLGASLAHGEFIARNLAVPVIGNGSELSLIAGLKPISRLVIDPTLTYTELYRKDGTPLYHGWIGRARTSLQFTRRLFLRLVLQYDEFGHRLDVEPLVTYRVNPFTLFYVGSSLGYHDYRLGGPVLPGQTGLQPQTRQFFAKFQYLLRW